MARNGLTVPHIIKSLGLLHADLHHVLVHVDNLYAKRHLSVVYPVPKFVVTFAIMPGEPGEVEDVEREVAGAAAGVEDVDLPPLHLSIFAGLILPLERTYR